MADEANNSGNEELFPFQSHFLRAYWERFTGELFPGEQMAPANDWKDQPIQAEEAPVATAAPPEHSAVESAPVVADDRPTPKTAEPQSEDGSPEPIPRGEAKKTVKRKGGSTAEELIAQREVFKNDFYDFQDAVQGFYRWADGSGDDGITLWAQLTSLDMEELRHITETEDAHLRRILATSNELLGTDEGWDEVRDSFQENKLGITNLRQKVMVSATETAIRRIDPELKLEKDVTLPSKDQMDLVFEAGQPPADDAVAPEKDEGQRFVGVKVKFRRGEIGKMDELILEGLQIARIYQKVNEDHKFKLVIVVFTTGHPEQVDRYMEQFSNQLRNIEPRAEEYLRFVPVDLLDQHNLNLSLRDAIYY